MTTKPTSKPTGKIPVPSASSGRLAMIANAAKLLEGKGVPVPKNATAAPVATTKAALAASTAPAPAATEPAPAIAPAPSATPPATTAAATTPDDGMTIPPELRRPPETPEQADARRARTSRAPEAPAKPAIVDRKHEADKATTQADPASTQETTVKTNTKTKTNRAAKRAAASTERRKPTAKAKAAARTPRGDAKPKGMVVEILKLSCRAKGVTPEELNALTKWKGAPWKWLFKNPKKTGYCDRWGYTFEVVKDDDGTHYKTEKKPEK